ncbi:hypothetical protein ACLB2K_070808 [Fragaria x ananassa]
MSLLVLASQVHEPDTGADVKLPLAYYEYAPCIWDDHFLSYSTTEVDIKLEQHVRELKEEVKRILMDHANVSGSQQIDLVNDLQRLGMAYHFENEIDEILKQIHHNYSCGTDDDDLYTAALRFRLLRQHGYNISCDIFNKFKDGNHQTFKKSLQSDVSGLLSLYEATHLRVHGEEILEEALAFTTTHLESIKHNLSPPLSNLVSHSLNQPLRTGVARVEARHYLSIYQECHSHNETLLTLAKLDFNLVQQLHQKELYMWWKNLDVKNKLPFARDRVTEVYFIWVLSVYFEPQFSFARRTSCKVTAILSIIDDIYDSQGTLEELELLTEAIQRAVKGAEVVCRLMDDIADYKFELERGTDISSVECYMKEHGATEEEAMTELRRRLSDAWKDINESFFLPNALPRPLLTRVLNFACAMDVAYKYEDTYTTHHASILKDFIVPTLVESVPL